jgi:hypothetical protein
MISSQSSRGSGGTSGGSGGGHRRGPGELADDNIIDFSISGSDDDEKDKDEDEYVEDTKVKAVKKRVK